MSICQTLWDIRNSQPEEPQDFVMSELTARFVVENLRTEHKRSDDHWPQPKGATLSLNGVLKYLCGTKVKLDDDMRMFEIEINTANFGPVYHAF